MIKIEHTDVCGFESAIRGMRNPMNSWDKSDSGLTVMNPTDVEFGYEPNYEYIVGENDLKLMKKLSKAGDDHGKFLRMINVTFDLTAPLYFLKEFDTYKVSTVSNSCSTMHKIHAKEFTLDDFSHEHLINPAKYRLEAFIGVLNDYRDMFLNFDKETDTIKKAFKNDKKNVWWQMIQLLPSSYNQKRTVQLNYQVLKSMYFARRNHKLDEWNDFCAWCESLPYFREVVIQDGSMENN